MPNRSPAASFSHPQQDSKSGLQMLDDKGRNEIPATTQSNFSEDHESVTAKGAHGRGWQRFLGAVMDLWDPR